MTQTRRAVQLLHELGLGEVLREMLGTEPGFAVALSRGLGEQDIHLALDLIDLGWPIRTSVSFLSLVEHVRLREVLLMHASDSEFEDRFLEILKRPKIDQVRLFETYQISGKDRGMLVPIARALLLKSPELANNPRELESRVEQQVQARFTGIAEGMA